MSGLMGHGLHRGGVPSNPRIPWHHIVPGIGFNDAGDGSDITSDTTLEVGDNTVPVDASSGAVTITLVAFTDAYQEVVISKRDSSGNTVTVAAAGSDTINGAATQVISAQYTCLRIRPGATEYMIA